MHELGVVFTIMDRVEKAAEVDRIRTEMKAKETFFIDLMSSPGSGKTTTLKRLIGDMKTRYRFGYR